MVRSPSTSLPYELLFLAACFLTSTLVLTIIFPAYPPIPLPSASASGNVEDVFSVVFFTSLLTGMLLSTTAPLFEYSARSVRSTATGASLRGANSIMGGVRLPTFSSFPVVRAVWYFLLLAPLPVSVAGVAAVILWEPGTVSQGLFKAPYSFDAVYIISIALLAASQQLGAGYIASVVLTIPPADFRVKSERVRQIALRLSWYLIVYNVLSLILMVMLMILSFIPMAALPVSLALCFFFVYFGVEVSRYGQLLVSTSPPDQ